MENNANQKPKICVAGVGAVGGLLAAMMGRQYEESISVIARGARAKAFAENGVVLNSECYGRQVCHPARITENGAEIGIQDYLFVCVKNYSLEQMAAQIRPCIGPDTVVLPVMNGVEAGDRLREMFPDALVCDGLIYTTTGANPDYSVTQMGGYTYLYVGSKIRDARHEAAVIRLYQMLKATDLDVRKAEDIQSEIWQKYVLNCAFNTVTARYITTTGVIRQNEQMKADFYALLSEAYAVGIAEGVKLPADLVEQKYQFMLTKQSDQATSSMKRDVEANRPTELDAFLGAVIRKAKLHQVAVPVSERYYKQIAEMQR